MSEIITMYIQVYDFVLLKILGLFLNDYQIKSARAVESISRCITNKILKL